MISGGIEINSLTIRSEFEEYPNSKWNAITNTEWSENSTGGLRGTVMKRFDYCKVSLGYKVSDITHAW